MEEVSRPQQSPEAVREALDSYYANKEWIDAEVEDMARRFGLR